MNGRISWGKARKIMLRDGQKCRYCGKHLSLEDVTFDHIKPQSKGGTDSTANLVVACAKCNNGFGSGRVKDILPETLTIKEVEYLIRYNGTNSSSRKGKLKLIKRKLGRIAG